MNPLVKKMSPTATQMIRIDHAHVQALFHKLQPDTSATVRGAIVRNICAALEIHAQVEEEIFYPALREAAIQSPALDKSVPEHDEMRSMIATVRELDGQRAAQDDALNELINDVMHHVADEETQLLPAAERFLGPDRLSELGARMTSRKMELAKPRAAEMAKDMAMAAPVKTGLLALGVLVAGTALVAAVTRGRQDRYDRY